MLVKLPDPRMQVERAAEFGVEVLRAELSQVVGLVAVIVGFAIVILLVSQINSERNRARAQERQLDLLRDQTQNNTALIDRMSTTNDTLIHLMNALDEQTLLLARLDDGMKANVALNTSRNAKSDSMAVDVSNAWGAIKALAEDTREGRKQAIQEVTKAVSEEFSARDTLFEQIATNLSKAADALEKWRDDETASFQRVEALLLEILTILKDSGTKPPPPQTPPAPIPAPPLFPSTNDTVLQWDWDTTPILDVEPGAPIPTGTPKTAVISANNTRNGLGAHTKVVPSAGKNVVEFYTHHNFVQRADGTGARLFLHDWGYWLPHAGKHLTVDYAFYLPEPLTVQANGSLGIGLQTKHANGVIWALDAENTPDKSGLIPWVWMPPKVVKPEVAAPYRIGDWNTVQVRSFLHMTNGLAEIDINGKLAIRFTGRTLPGGMGLALYDINAIGHEMRVYFSDVRFEIRAAA